MIKMQLTGNLTKDPEMKTLNTKNGPKEVAVFTVACKSRAASSKFVRVTAWGKLAQNCKNYLAKGRKVYVIGEPGASAYNSKQGKPTASLELTADEVEFLSPANDNNGSYGGNSQEFNDVDLELPF